MCFLSQRVRRQKNEFGRPAELFRLNFRSCVRIKRNIENSHKKSNNFTPKAEWKGRVEEDTAEQVDAIEDARFVFEKAPDAAQQQLVELCQQ